MRTTTVSPTSRIAFLNFWRYASFELSSSRKKSRKKVSFQFRSCTSRETMQLRRSAAVKTTRGGSPTKRKRKLARWQRARFRFSSDRPEPEKLRLQNRSRVHWAGNTFACHWVERATKQTFADIVVLMLARCRVESFRE